MRESYKTAEQISPYARKIMAWMRTGTGTLPEANLLIEIETPGGLLYIDAYIDSSIEDALMLTYPPDEFYSRYAPAQIVAVR